MGWKCKRTKCLVECLHKTHGYRAHGVTVVGILKRGKRCFLCVANVVPVLDGDLDGRLYSTCSIRGEVNLAISPGPAGKSFCEGKALLVGEVAKNAVLENSRLFLDGCHQAWMGVTKGTGPPGGDGVQVAVVLVIIQVRSLASDDDRALSSGPNRIFRVGVPDVIRTGQHGGLGRGDAIEWKTRCR